MNTHEIEEKAEKLLPNFEGVFARDYLPSKKRRNRILIMNTDTSNLPGKHWIAVIVHNNVGYCFDPLGFPPSLTLSSWLNRHYSRWSSNTNKRVQPLYSDLCGYYCLYFLFWATKSFTTLNDMNTLLDTLFPITNDIIQYEQTIKKFRSLIA